VSLQTCLPTLPKCGSIVGSSLSDAAIHDAALRSVHSHGPPPTCLRPASSLPERVLIQINTSTGIIVRLGQKTRSARRATSSAMSTKPITSSACANKETAAAAQIGQHRPAQLLEGSLPDLDAHRVLSQEASFQLLNRRAATLLPT